MINGLIGDYIDRLTDKFYNFDIHKDHDRTILTGGWLVLFACLVLLLGSGLILCAVGLALLGAGFFFGGLYEMLKAEKRRFTNSYKRRN